MTGCKGMARIDAHPHPRLILDQFNNIPEILPRRANNISSPRHILQHRHHRLRRLVRLIQLRRNPANRRRPGLTTRRARVEVVKLDPQLLAPLEVVEERRVRLRCLGLVGLREVDEV